MSAQIPIVSADAGNPQALSDPNSPASIMKKAKESHAQSVADTKYDAPPPPREGYANYEPSKPKEIIAAFLVSSAFLLFLYSVAP